MSIDSTIVLDIDLQDFLFEKVFVDSREELTEGRTRRVGTRRMGRIKLVIVRVRRGKVQRRKKFSAVRGYTIRRGKMLRMSSKEKLHRKMGARRAKVKIRSKRSGILRKRKISLRKRKALGY